MRTNAVKFVRIYIVLSLIVAFGATACDRKNLTLAEAGAVTFHARLNSGQRLDIYADADEDFQKAGIAASAENSTGATGSAVRLVGDSGSGDADNCCFIGRGDRMFFDTLRNIAGVEHRSVSQVSRYVC